MDIDTYQFSSREKEVVELLLQGKSNKEMALALEISVSTVEFHLKNVYQKLKVRSRAEAILRLQESIGSTSKGDLRETTGKEITKPRESLVDGTVGKVENAEHTFSTRRILMKQRSALIGGVVVIVILLATVIITKFAAISHPSPTATAANTSAEISYLGTSFTIPAELGSRASNEIITESLGYFTTWPQHTRFILGNYPLQNTTYQPQIQIYPAQEYEQMSQDSESNIKGLQSLLETKQLPALTEPLPFLPFQGAAQVFHTKEEFLSFQNGNGVRYLTQYSQAHFPIENLSHLEILYTYQGLTSDGKYYVSIIMPVALDYVTTDETNATPFPEHGVPFNWDNPDATQYPAYLEKAVSYIAHDNNPFHPSLEALDALVRSLLVTDPQ